MPCDASKCSGTRNLIRVLEYLVGYRVAVVGATGNVGREMMQVLAEREFPCDEVAAVASSRSTGSEVEFGDTGKMLKCKKV